MSLQNIHLHLNENILFITQDVALASDVWDLGDSRSVRSKRVEVAKITKNGLLEEFEIDGDFESNADFDDDKVNSIVGNYVGDLSGVTTGTIKGIVKGNIIGDMKNDIQ
ncbi:MAG: hypothetical protein IJ558_05320 [Treponema sp.]|nr:hypothetical protein [Treponema sp.]